MEAGPVGAEAGSLGRDKTAPDTSEPAAPGDAGSPSYMRSKPPRPGTSGHRPKWRIVAWMSSQHEVISCRSSPALGGSGSLVPCTASTCEAAERLVALMPSH